MLSVGQSRRPESHLGQGLVENRPNPDRVSRGEGVLGRDLEVDELGQVNIDAIVENRKYE